jgi:hypothetical protein
MELRNILVLVGIDMSRRSINVSSVGISMIVCIYVGYCVDVKWVNGSVWHLRSPFYFSCDWAIRWPNFVFTRILVLYWRIHARQKLPA